MTAYGGSTRGASRTRAESLRLRCCEAEVLWAGAEGPRGRLVCGVEPSLDGMFGQGRGYKHRKHEYIRKRMIVYRGRSEWNSDFPFGAHWLSIECRAGAMLQHGFFSQLQT